MPLVASVPAGHMCDLATATMPYALVASVPDGHMCDLATAKMPLIASVPDGHMCDLATATMLLVASVALPLQQTVPPSVLICQYLERQDYIYSMIW